MDSRGDNTDLQVLLDRPGCFPADSAPVKVATDDGRSSSLSHSSQAADRHSTARARDASMSAALSAAAAG